jgi:hypothetical protein
MLVVLRQAARVYIAEQWMEEIHGTQSVWALEEQLVAKRAAAGQASTSYVLERLPRWILGPDQHLFDGARVDSSADRFRTVVDLLVIASSFVGWHLLELAK